MAKYIDKERAKKRLISDYAYAAARILDELPAADVVEVKHGRWMSTSDGNKKKCSECEVIHLIAQYPVGQANYCPNCGAKMDEKETV